MKNRKPTEEHDLCTSKVNINFRADLMELNRIANLAFDRLMLRDLNSEEDRKEAFANIQGLKDLLETLCEDHLQAKTETELSIEELKLEINQTAEYQVEGVLQCQQTHLAMKDPYSFIICTHKDGFSHMENRCLVYQGELPGADNWVDDLVFVRHLDCYLMVSYNKIYRKDMDDEPPYEYLEQKVASRTGSCMLYSEINQRLIVHKRGNTVAVVNLEDKKEEIVVTENGFAGDIVDFRLSGGRENNIIALTSQGCLLQYQFNYSRKSGTVAKTCKFSLNRSRKEKPASLAVCLAGKYILVEIEGQRSNTKVCSRMLVFMANRTGFSQVAELDVYNNSLIGLKHALACYGYSGDHLVWVGLASGAYGLAQAYDYNLQTRELTELRDARLMHGEADPMKLQRLGDTFWYIGKYGRINSMDLRF